jgi:preprotein translocase subunit SecG
MKGSLLPLWLFIGPAIVANAALVLHQFTGSAVAKYTAIAGAVWLAVFIVLAFIANWRDASRRPRRFERVPMNQPTDGAPAVPTDTDAQERGPE